MREPNRSKRIVRIGVVIATLIALASLATGNQTSAAPQNPAPTVEPPIVFAISNDNSPPMAEIRENELIAGILKNVGDAIAAEVHRQARYVVIPRKRLDAALEEGAVDGVCYHRPEWVSAPLNWSQAFIPDEILLVAGVGIAKPKKLDDAAGKVIGMVLGYRYPELNPLAGNFQREDAPNMSSNIKKLMAGRVPYAVIDRLSLQYEEKMQAETGVFAYLSIAKIQAACGFSPASKIPFAELNQAIRKLVNDGTVEHILAQYR